MKSRHSNQGPSPKAVPDLEQQDGSSTSYPPFSPPVAELHLLDRTGEEALELVGTHPFKIGRAANNDLILQSRFVSAHHARLLATTNGWSIEDLTSRNGVLVNGQRIEGLHHLRDGDALHFGSEAYRFRVSPEPPATEQTPPLATAIRPQSPPARASNRKLPSARILIGVTLVAALGWAILAYLSPPSPDSLTTPPKDRPEATATAPMPPAPAQGTKAVASPLAMSNPADILANHDPRMRLFRMSTQGGIYVLDYPSLAALGDTFNRIAILVEEKDMPRDRIIGVGELGAYLEQEGLTASSFYFGHNYRANDLARFFNLAAQDGMSLTEGETELLDALLKSQILHEADQRYAVSNEPVAVLGVSQAQEDDSATPELERIDSDLRNTILRHELSHGVFFTDPDYRHYVRRMHRNRSCLMVLRNVECDSSAANPPPMRSVAPRWTENASSVRRCGCGSSTGT